MSVAIELNDKFYHITDRTKTSTDSSKSSLEGSLVTELACAPSTATRSVRTRSKSEVSKKAATVVK